MIGPALLEFTRSRRGEILDELRALVEHESPSQNVAALDSLRLKLTTRLRGLCSFVRVIKGGAAAGHVSALFNPSSEAAPLLVLGHFDTVWPIGTLAARPFRVENGRAYGPGAYDMKASLVILFAALEAIKHLRETGFARNRSRPVEILLTSDEEIGSPDSRARIEKLALTPTSIQIREPLTPDDPDGYSVDPGRQTGIRETARYRWEEIASTVASVLVIEPPLPDGSLKTARKGVGGYRIEVDGRAAHAGVEPEKGASAIVELAHQILRIQGIAAPSRGTSINVGTIEGGTTPNVVPAKASARVDVRASTTVEAMRVDEALRALRSVLEGTTIRVSGGFNRPPMERTPGIASLFEQARQIGRTLGMELTEGSTGGGSDGNFTAALGIPTLDGLGALGGGAHAEDEHVIIDSIPERAALLAALLMNL